MGFVELLVVEGRELLFCFGILGVIFVLVFKKKNKNKETKKKPREKHTFISQHTWSSTIWKADFRKTMI